MAIPKLKFSSGNSASTTTSTSMSNTDTATPLTSITNFQAAPTPGEGMVIIDEGAATEELAYSTAKSGSSLTTPLANRGAEGGSPQAHGPQVSVKGILSAGMWNDMITALLNVHVQSTGALDTTKVVDLTTSQSLTNKALVSPTTTGTDTGTATLTNKRVTKRVVATTQSATPTINTDNTDVSRITGLAQAITSMTTNLTGTPVDGDTLIIDITDNGSARAISWGTSFESSGTVTLPTTTVLSTKLTVGFRWNTATTKWTCVAIA